MIRVALDARRLQDPVRTGVGRRLANLLPLVAPQVELVLLTDGTRPSPPEAAALGMEEVRLRRPAALPEPFWLQVSAARWLRTFDGVFHGTYNAIPFRRHGRSVVTIYDLSWLHHPEDYSGLRRVSFATQARWSAAHADAVITISEHVRAELLAAYPVATERILLAPPALDPAFSPARSGEAGPILERLGVHGEFVVALGGAARRGVEVAVEAWRRLGPDGPALVVVGPVPVRREDGVVYTGALDDHEWPALLAAASVLCYPTRYEGYGMPALEAAGSGVPVVCAPIGPLPEVLGDAAQWCATPQVADIEDGLRRLLDDPARRDALRAAGLARAAQAPTWAASAAAELAAYEMAASR